VCKTHFCYQCNKVLDPNDPYKHFGGVDQKGPHTCILFEKSEIEDPKLVRRTAEQAAEIWRKKHPSFSCPNFNIEKYLK
jgi:hypothetical protein